MSDDLAHLPPHVQRWIGSVANDPAVVNGLSGFDNLRPYQRESVLACAARVRKTLEPLLITLPTGAGKSWVIAALASVVRSIATASSGKQKKVLVLAQSKELVFQNYEKLISAGYNATIYANGLNSKDASGDIVFGSRQTVINAVDSFAELDYEFAAVFIDEAHSVPPETRYILDALRQINPHLRVIGLTATPYALGKGYIFAQDTFRNLPPLREIHTRDPFFAELVYDKSPHELIDDGYLSPPVLGTISDAYNTQGLERSQTGNFTEKSNNEVFVNGQTNLTKRIVQEVKKKAKTRKSVMLFAQNRAHAQQILSFLPTKQSALVDGKTKARERDEAVKAFKARKLKYMVTVSALATGFDCESVSMIAVLRHTASQAFFQQIIGRGLRLCPEIGKKDCLILDYAQNLSPEGDLFTPKIELGVPGDAREFPVVEVTCPDCGGDNRFRKASWPEGTAITDTGFLYYVKDNKMLVSSDEKPIAGHMGSQCGHLLEVEGRDTLRRCSYAWGAVICPRCERRNSHRTDFCIACEQPLSKRARRLTLSVSRDENYTHRLVRVVDPPRTWLFAGRSAKTGRPTLRVSLQVQELPYMVPTDPPKRGRRSKEDEDDQKQDDWLPAGYQIVRPEPFRLTAWINPTVDNPGAKATWEAFKAYAQANQISNGQWGSYPAIDNLLKALANPHSDLSFSPPMYLVYTKKTVNADKAFYNLLEFHRQHPNAEAIDVPPNDSAASPSGTSAKSVDRNSDALTSSPP